MSHDVAVHRASRLQASALRDKNRGTAGGDRYRRVSGLFIDCLSAWSIRENRIINWLKLNMKHIDIISGGIRIRRLLNDKAFYHMG